nr:copia protein [Tanacetum cinerariifolium]
MTIIGTKWIFRNKLDKNGVVSRNKAKLVAQCYNQQEGINYDETYALVARLKSIRILLAYSYALDFKLFQMDVKSAFLNGFINEKVYVAQPLGFTDFEKPNHVYKLKKALYGLKQAPKADPDPKPSNIVIVSSNEFIQPKKLDKNMIAKPRRSNKRNIKMSTIHEEVETEGMEARDAKSGDLQDGDLGAGKENNGGLEANGQGDLDEVMNDYLEGNDVNVEGNISFSSEVPGPIHLNKVLNPGLGKMFNNDKVRDNVGKNKIKGAMSFVSVAEGMANSSNNKLKLFPLLIDEVGYREISGHLRRMWRMYDLDKIIVLENGLYYFKFKSVEGMQIAYGRDSYARVLIKVNATEGLVDSIDACYKSIGRTMKLRVEYAWIPPVCSHYKPGVDKGNDDGWIFVSYRIEWRSGVNYGASHNYKFAARNTNNGRKYNGRGNVGDNVRMPVRNVNQASSSKDVTNEYVPVGNKENKESDGFVNVSKKRLSALDNEDGDADMDEEQVARNDTDIGFKTDSRSGKIKKQESQCIHVLNTKKQTLEVDLFMCLQILLTKEIKEMWTDKIEDYFDSLIELQKTDKINRHLDNNDIDKMHDEVAKDTSAHATFMTQDNVSNVMDSVLWKDPESHKNIAGSYPWVLLEDFNITLFVNENINLSGRVDHGIKDFKDCVDSLEVENIPMTGMFILGSKKDMTLIQTVKEFWNALAKGSAMYVLAKRLKLMKRHMRRLNRRNGNVFANVKRLKVKLEKVQVKLNKNPYRSVLREKELKCSNDHKSRLNKCKIKSIYDEEGVFFIGVDVADNEEDALEMVKPVSNEEVKTVIFNIEDIRPLARWVHLKVFKASWEIVAGDLCKAVKEFFSSGKMLDELNTYIISLVPKSNNPRKTLDYRPIVCCGVVYKCISKELMNGYTWKGKIRKCTFKVDIQKAYDIVSWDFLKLTLEYFRFHIKMAKRGLRQGDNVLPYLFTIITKVFNLMLKRHISLDKRCLDEFSLSSGLHSFILWMAIKGKLKTQDRLSKWLNILDMAYRNFKLFRMYERSEDKLFSSITDTVRLKLMGLTLLKASPDVKKAVEVWNFPLKVNHKRTIEKHDPVQA